ncbi:peroxin-3 protein [Rhizoctonia solani AG-3 Rhs1AP]|uniref:Peroxin-3 protein n=2 Tax=Rhizoctonia solani AG-3 TaxID=1086053 RepID=A0A074S9G0_9AGAM|nr:peroxin-3 protein [Rhizoctonia solani AG-3 Rhs1AP]KEP53548.1 peroxin-3 protein [Rhizoctonia solani 123E]
MLESTRNYVYDRRRGLLTTLGGLGVGYVTGQYIVSRLEEVRDRIVKEKGDKDNLVRRFQQNVQDSTFTTMAHLPTLATQVMSDMDVESLISRLQQSRAPRQPLAQPLAPPQLSDPPPSNVTTSARESEPPISNVAKSWVEHFSASSENSLSLSAGDVATTSAEQTLSLPTHSIPPTTGTDVDTQSEAGVGATTEFHSLPTDNGDADLERSSEGLEGARDELESIIEADINVDPNAVREQGSASERMDAKSDSLMSVPETSSQASGSSLDKDSAVMVNLDYAEPTPSAETFPAPPPLSNKEKLALWKELTTLTFTRALTSLYALAFLTLLTHTQLSLLARYRYLAAIREARRAESKEQRATLGSLFFGTPAYEDDDLFSVHPDSEIGLFGRDGVGSLTERKYLTLGWWFLNRGWKNIGERVREAVSEVFNGMSLKSQISPKELEDLILQVRAMIEGDPKTFLLDFDPLATLLPDAPTEISTTLASGGLTSSLAHVDPALSTLLSASRTHISSADFAIALRKCLDFGTIAMKDGLIRSGEFGETANTSADDESAKVKLAALLPGVARWTHLALNGVPNEIIEGFAELREVTGYSAIVLSSFEGILGSYA